MTTFLIDNKCETSHEPVWVGYSSDRVIHYNSIFRLLFSTYNKSHDSEVYPDCLSICLSKDTTENDGHNAKYHIEREKNTGMNSRNEQALALNIPQISATLSTTLYYSKLFLNSSQ